jgi:MSHA biogenesis protein MshJ
MKALWRSWADRHASLSRREQIMVAVAVTAAVGFLLMTFWVNPATRRGADLRSGLATRQTELTALDNQIVTLKSQLDNPDADGRRQLAELQARLGAIDARIGQLDDQLVPPQRMGQVLQAVLARHRGLALVSLRSLPAEPLLAPPADKGAAGGKPGEQRGENIYRHGLEVRLAGSYADLLDYVAELERTPQRLLWGGMMLSVTTYPRSELTLTVYTLSRDRDWLAV